MNQRAVIIAVVVVVLAGVGGYVGLVKPPRDDVAAVETTLQTQRDALTSAQTALQTAQLAKSQYRAAYAEVVRLGKAVPSDDDLQSLLVQLSATARASEVRFVALERGGGTGAGAVPTGTAATVQTNLPPGATVGSSGFPVVSLKLTFTGRYFALTDFLQALDGYVETGPTLRVKGRLLTIDGFTLNGDQDGEGPSDSLTASVSATAYLVSPVEGATAGATSAGPAGAGTAVSATATPTSGSAG